MSDDKTRARQARQDELSARMNSVNRVYGLEMAAQVGLNDAVRIYEGVECTQTFDFAGPDAPRLNMQAATAYVTGIGRGLYLAGAMQADDLEAMRQEREKKGGQ